MSSDMQAAWKIEYLKCFNATEAARRVGYKHPNVKGPQNKKLFADEIKAALSEKMMEADEVLVRLAEQARNNIGDFFTFEPVAPDETTGDGNEEAGEENEDEPTPEFRLDLEAIKRNGHLVKSLTWTRYGPKIELYDAQSALRDIGKHHGLFDQNIKHSGEVGVYNMTREEWEALRDKNNSQVKDALEDFGDTLEE